MTTTFEIENLKCDGCVKTATEEITSLEGVSNVNVSLENNSITFKSDENLIIKVEEKLKEIGYSKKEEISLLDKAKSYLNK